MGERRTALLLHPVRLRIVQAALGREVTASQLASLLPDVPTASLYRHVATLVEGGVLEVVAERAVRGATERTLAVALPAASLGAQDVAHLTPEQHRDAVTAFLAGVLQSFTDYLAAPGADPVNDGFGYRQVAVWADDEELEELLAGLRELLAPAAAREPGGRRRRRVLTTVLLPDPPDAPRPD